MRETGQSCGSPRSPSFQQPCQPGEAEPVPMLPGFRFLVAAIVFSMSVLVFGLGAAALLRSAHEQFASIPARRIPPEPVFAQPQMDPTTPTLALLRIEPSSAQETVNDDDAIPARDVTGTVTTEPVEPETSAAPKPEDSAPMAEAAEPETPAAETLQATQVPPPQTDVSGPTSATGLETKLAALADASAAVQDVAPASETFSPERSMAAAKIATLGGPAVTIDESASTKNNAKPDRSAVRKRIRAQRARERRRIAELERLAREQAAQLAANPFGTPTTMTPTRPATRPAP